MADADEAPKMTGEVVAAMIMFSAASSSLLLINKLCIHLIPAPSLIAALQFAVCTVFILLLKHSGYQEVDDWEWIKVRQYLLYIGMFVTTIYCNFKALEVSNVETLIVARSCVPVTVSFLDFTFLGRRLPSLRSWGAMLLMVSGAAGYVLTDKQFALDGWSAYSWVILYLCVPRLDPPTSGFRPAFSPRLDPRTFGSLALSRRPGPPPVARPVAFCADRSGPVFAAS